jgi:UDP-N-acetylglucosamine transferase subunit ALG13
MIFLTVGTQFSFDRLVRAVDEALDGNGGREEIFAQIGDSSYKPRNFPAVASLDKHQFDESFRRASGIIWHAGMGTIGMALEQNKPLLVLPRRKKFGEVVNDHQVAIARKFEQLGHVLAAYELDQIADKMSLLKTFVPRPRQACPDAIGRHIADYLNKLAVEGRGGDCS